MPMTLTRKRVAIASLMEETNSFSPIETTIEVFKSYYILRGEELRTGYGPARVEVPAMLEALRGADIEAVPLYAAYAAASGPVRRTDFDIMVGEIEQRLATAGPLDGLLLALHGALVVEDAPDGDGEVIERLRARLGPDVPIGVSLDLHGHITPRKLQPNTFLVGYQEYPHIDMYETGQRTARLMCDVLAGRRRPVMALVKRPVIVPAVCGRTTDGPLGAVALAARAAEASGEVLHASIFPVQPWIDAPDLGFAALVCADGDAAAAERVATRLADMVWERRRDFDLGLLPLAETIRVGLTSDGMTLVGDTGDAPTGGSAADSTAVLEGLLAGGARDSERLSLLTMCDPAGAAAARRIGVGNEIRISVGHSLSTADGSPLPIVGTVLSVSDGTYVMEDAGANGMTIHMGPTAVIGIGGIRLLLRSRPSIEWDTAMYRSQGLEPATAALVFVKSPSHFRVSFGPLAARILLADTPGPTRADIRKLPYTRVTRPLSPLDDI